MLRDKKLSIGFDKITLGELPKVWADKNRLKQIVYNLTGNAEFWLGETYWQMQDYSSAAQAYLNSYKQYPKSSRAAEISPKPSISFARESNTAISGDGVLTVRDGGACGTTNGAAAA